MYISSKPWGKFSEEAALVGQLLLLTGELEYKYCLMAAHTSKSWAVCLKALYKLHSTAARISVAETLLKADYSVGGLSEEINDATDRIRHCIKIRNVYAHCHWASDNQSLYFCDIEKATAISQDFKYNWKPICNSIITKQLEYFKFTLLYLQWLWEEFQTDRGSLGKNSQSKPELLLLPSSHNSASQIVPEWLEGENRILHIKRAQEDEARRRKKS